MTVLEFERPRAVSSKQPVRRQGSFEPEATGPGSWYSQVASKSRTQVGPSADLLDRIACAAEVCRTSTVEGVVDKDRNFEVDPLTDGKPVELIPQHRSNMVELPPVRDQPGCRVE